ncbi:MAG: hypothetical protein ACXVI7_09030 [Halobacteriota archaeon]
MPFVAQVHELADLVVTLTLSAEFLFVTRDGLRIFSNSSMNPAPSIPAGRAMKTTPVRATTEAQLFPLHCRHYFTITDFVNVMIAHHIVLRKPSAFFALTAASYAVNAAVRFAASTTVNIPHNIKYLLYEVLIVHNLMIKNNN